MWIDPDLAELGAWISMSDIAEIYLYFLKFIYFIYLFLAALGLCCCTRVSLVVARGLLIPVASLVVEHRL